MLGRITRLVVVLVAVLAIALVTMAAVGAAAGVSRSAVKSTTSVSIGSQATLASSLFGPGVNVTINYSCFPGFGGKGGYPGGGAFGSVSVTDLQGNQGFGSWSPNCNDTRQTAVVFVQAFGTAKGGGPGSFVAGAGAASAFVCGFDCNSTSREIKIS
jgi:hypothetical protein